MPHFDYLIAGVPLRTASPLGDLPRSDLIASAIWRLVKRDRPLPFKTPRPRRRARLLEQKDGSLFAVWPEERGFWIRPHKRRIEFEKDYGKSRAVFQDTLLGPILSYVSVMNGRSPLHGSAVRVADKAICFLGAPGDGKSTLAASFVLAGHALIADDLLNLTEEGNGFMVWPGHPEIRLWPGSGRRLLRSFFSLPKVVPAASKRKLDPRHWPGGFCREPVPLKAVFQIVRRRAAKKPRLEKLDKKQAFLALTGNVYNISYSPPQSLERQFLHITRIIERVPVMKLVVPKFHLPPSELPAEVLPLLNGRFFRGTSRHGAVKR